MSTQIVYQTEARATGGGRDGLAGTTDAHFTVKLTVPREMGGPGGEGVNPEQLFATGYAACFLGALRYVGSLDGKKVPPDATVTTTVGIGPREDGGFGLAVALAVSVPGMEKAEAEALVAKAHHVCPYSHATRNSIDVKLSVV